MKSTDSPTLSSFFFSLSLILICHSPLPANADLVDDVCKNTKDNSRCLKVLRADVGASSAKDYTDLSKSVLELAVKKGTESQAFLKELLKKKESPSIRQCAFSYYDAVVRSFRSALIELDEDVQSANYDSKVAGDEAKNCENELASRGIQNPEISSRNNDMMLLSNIAFVVTGKIKS